MRERQPHWVSGLVYLLMGWLVVFKLPALVALLNPVALALLDVGGVYYTVGVRARVLVWAPAPLPYPPSTF